MEIWNDISKGEVIKTYPAPNVPVYNNRQAQLFLCLSARCLNNFKGIYVHTLAFPKQGCHCIPLVGSTITVTFENDYHLH